MVETEHYEHEFYKHCDEKDADAIAWAFVNKEKLVKFPFKFPALGAKEIRANVLYTGLCHTDVKLEELYWGETIFSYSPRS